MKTASEWLREFWNTRHQPGSLTLEQTIKAAMDAASAEMRERCLNAALVVEEDTRNGVDDQLASRSIRALPLAKGSE